MKIFLSYAREDKEDVRALFARLKASGFNPWMDTEDILPGQEWEVCIKEAIRASDAFLILLTSHSVSKRGVIQKEIRTALEVQEEKLDGDIYIVPVRLVDCDIPAKLSKYQAADLFKEKGWSKLIATLESQYAVLHGTSIIESQDVSISTNVDAANIKVEGTSYIVEGRYPEKGSKKLSPLTLGISKHALGAYAKRGQSVAIAQFFEIVAKGIKNTRYIFRGINRPLSTNKGSDRTVLVYVWKPSYDAEWAGSKFTGKPIRREPPKGVVFIVYVSIQDEERQAEEAIGQIEQWNWVKEDKWLREAPVDWDERYGELVWRRK